MWHTGCTGQQQLAMGRIQDGPILRNTVLIDIFSIGKVFYMWIYTSFLKNHILTVIEKVDVTFNRRHSTFFPSIDLYIFFDVPFRKG